MSQLTLTHIRHAWAAHQGLVDPQPEDPVQTLDRRGWTRTLGGASAYLAVLARSGQLDGARLDAAVAAGELWVLPAARGCIYLVPRADVPLALRWGWLTAKKRADRDVQKSGTRWAELEDVAAAALELLRAGSLTTQRLGQALPPGTVRSLGAAGKKVGMSSTLPLSLRLLESRGLIRRVLASGRLDKESYGWEVLATSPFDGCGLPDDLAGLATPLVRRFLGHTGPATRREVADWAGCSQRDVRAALSELGAVALDVAGVDPKDPLMCLPEHADGVGDAPPGDWSLLAMLDPYTDHRNRMAWLAEPRHHDRELSLGGLKRRPISEMKTAWQRLVLCQGRIAGLWEFNPETEQVEVGLYEPAPNDTLDALMAQVARVRDFLVSDLGHGRCFSLDTPAAMLKRVATVREQDHVLA